MKELERMIAECAEWRKFYAQRREQAQTRGERSSAGIEGLAIAIRERALKDAREAILREPWKHLR